MTKNKLAIIGGSGLYEIEGLEKKISYRQKDILWILN